MERKSCSFFGPVFLCLVSNIQSQFYTVFVCRVYAFLITTDANFSDSDAIVADKVEQSYYK